MCDLFNGCFAPKATIGLWYTGFTEILLGEDVGSNLAPMSRYFDVFHFEDYFTIGVTDNRGSVIVLKLVVHRRIVACVVAFELKAFGGGRFF